MAGLLASERHLARQHFFHDVLVADRAAHHGDARLAVRDLQADVAHDGGDHRVSAQPAFALKLPRAHQQHGVAVDDRTAMVHENRPIAVAVERDAHLTAPIHDRFRKTLGVRRPTLQVDVASVGLVRNDDRVEPQSGQQLGGNDRRRAVRAVDGERHAAERSGVRKHAAQMLKVGVSRLTLTHTGGLSGHGSPRRVGDNRLHFALDAFGELLAPPGKHFDAVVLERIVRCGNDDARVVAAQASQICDRRRRHDAGARDDGPLAGGAMRQLGFNPVARFARVAADEQPGADSG